MSEGDAAAFLPTKKSHGDLSGFLIQLGLWAKLTFWYFWCLFNFLYIYVNYLGIIIRLKLKSGKLQPKAIQFEIAVFTGSSGVLCQFFQTRSIFFIFFVSLLLLETITND